MAAILMLLICTFIDCLDDMPLTSHVGNSHVVRSHCDLALLGGRGRDYFSLSRGSNFSPTWEYFLLGVAENSYSAVHIYAGVNKYASPCAVLRQSVSPEMRMITGTLTQEREG